MARRRRYVSPRQRRERARHIRRLLRALMAVAALACLMLVPGLRRRIAGAAREGLQAAQAFAGLREEQVELTLPAMEVYALQLGVYDSGESAESERQRLYAEGIPCMIWQREKMRLICAVSLSRETLDAQAPDGQEAYVITDSMEEVTLRLSAGENEVEEALALLRMPDDMFALLLQSEQEAPLADVVKRVREAARKAGGAHPENMLYTQLAQSMTNWCALMESTARQVDADTARRYAAVTMCTLCRELRMALLGSAPQTS